MWLFFALITFFAWGTADLFYKKSNVETEKYSHLKTSIFVGVVMGITALATMIAKGIDYNPLNLLIYLPVSSMYILSMTVGYFGLRYLELSVSSPIQNASGAVSCILLMIVLREIPDALSIAAIILVTAGVILLGVAEKKKENAYEIEQNKKYKIGFKAFMMPILYCIIDSLGTFFDGWYLDDFTKTPLAGVTEENFEDVANISYEFTFLIIAVILFIYVRVIRKEKIELPKQGNRVAAAAFETAGQFSYVYALSGNGVVAAPVIASYCVCSAVLARIILKEKLTKSQYISVALVVAGIVLLGIVEGLGE
ncbi:MAG: DMT family transporter [Clostridia bacterium]|nr:DMT family transporter [Clostridia bacterium]